MNNLNLAYESIVSRYIREYRPYANKESLHIRRMTTLSEAISFASSCLLPTGKRHPHQYRIPARALVQAHQKLLSTNFSTISNFDELHQLINSEISNIYRIGPLTVYDISHRIGIFLKMGPKYIYLHRGTSIGAKALGLDITQVKIAKEKLPLPFQKLAAHELEDCLCIYKSELWELNTANHHSS